MKKIIRTVMIFCVIGFITCLPVKATENSSNQSGQLMMVKEETAVKSSPDESADTIITYATGESVFVIGETEDGWYEVFYQGKTGYVLKDKLKQMAIDGKATDTEAENQAYITALDEELGAMEAEGKMFVEEVERQREERKHSSVWGVVIGLLIIGILATGVISTVRTNKKEDTDVIDLDKES